ncbi:hypothetical protein LEP1GSC029_2284 [Leptospira interrogans str. 2002000626]|uniref:Uncharacterized protein n=1 Tax=Leptospira interrogans str. 2002000626 TaxID=996803 RepID=A0A829CZ38_LEPIR|nr:hypothetical protein LEP1GSC029_2284 [Leptospira interrogans str. 2002000626]
MPIYFLWKNQVFIKRISYAELTLNKMINYDRNVDYEKVKYGKEKNFLAD